MTTVNFALVEQLRERALLRKKDMAQLFGVTQLTYQNWVAGKSIRKSKEAKVSAVLSQLVQLIQLHNWPDPTTARLTGAKRFATLKALLSPEVPADPVIDVTQPNVGEPEQGGEAVVGQAPTVQ